MNTGEPELIGLYSAERRVLEIQAKLNRPVPQGVELAFAARVVSAGLRR